MKNTLLCIAALLLTTGCAKVEKDQNFDPTLSESSTQGTATMEFSGRIKAKFEMSSQNGDDISCFRGMKRNEIMLGATKMSPGPNGHQRGDNYFSIRLPGNTNLNSEFVITRDDHKLKSVLIITAPVNKTNWSADSCKVTLSNNKSILYAEVVCDKVRDLYAPTAEPVAFSAQLTCSMDGL
jgi:hypothetical protein